MTGSRGGLARLLLLAALVAITILLYARSVGFEFLYYDDPFFVTENPRVRDGLTPASIGWALTAAQGFYHPVTWLSLMLDVSLFGCHPAAFHRTNLLLHAANACLLFLVLESLRLDRRTAFLASLIFSIHPLNVESVAWISERKGLLAACFGLLTVLAHVAHVRRPATGRALLTASAYVLALCSKTSVLPLPAVLVLLEVWPLRRIGDWRSLTDSLREKAFLFGAAGAFVLLTLHAEANVGGINAGGVRFALAAPVLSLITYAGMFAAPLRQNMWHHDFRGVAGPAGIGAALLAAGVTLWAWRQPRVRPLIATGLVGFLIMILPVSGIIPISNHVAAERYFYLPGIGLAVIAAAAAATALRQPLSRRLPLTAACLVLLGFWTMRAIDQIGVWRSEVTLCRATLRSDPENLVALNNLAWALSHRVPAPGPAELAEALRAAESAARLTGNRDPNIVGTLAAVHAAAGDYRRAYMTAHDGAMLASLARQKTLGKELAAQRDLYLRELDARLPSTAPAAPGSLTDRAVNPAAGSAGSLQLPPKSEP